MALQNYRQLDEKFQDGDHDRGTPRSIEGADYQTFLTSKGKEQTVKVTDFSTNKIVLEGTFYHDKRDPQSSLRTPLGPLAYHQTSKYYPGNPLTSSIKEFGRWLGAVALGKEYISTTEELAKVGNPTWNEAVTSSDFSFGWDTEAVETTDERGNSVTSEIQRPIIDNIVRDRKELMRAATNINIQTTNKRHFLGPEEHTEIYLIRDDEKDKKIVDINRMRYIGGIAPLGAILEGSLSKHEKLNALLKPLYKVPVFPVPNIRSGFEVRVGKNDEHMLLKSISDYIRLGQIIERPKTHVEVYNGAFKYDAICDFTCWDAFQAPNPWFWWKYITKKKIHGEETDFRERRHAMNIFSVLKGVNLQGENGYGARMELIDELIYSDPLFEVYKYGPGFEEKIGHIILKRQFDDSDAIEFKTVEKTVYDGDGRPIKTTDKIKQQDTDKIKCEYSINLFLEDDYKRNGAEMINGFLTLLAETQHKLRLGYQELEKFGPYDLPTCLDDGLDAIVTARNLNEVENPMGKFLDQDMTPMKLYWAIKKLFNFEAPPEFKEYMFWDEDRLNPVETRGQMTFEELELMEEAAQN